MFPNIVWITSVVSVETRWLMTQKTGKQNKEAENEEVLFILIYNEDTGSPSSVIVFVAWPSYFYTNYTFSC